ncbi:MAG: hypothetical protein DLM55_00820 [Acidimicrobiales bacterium]|nr:MAG: hypothetical protein DLM55_00820 [Acidimicrobiales bacterium]
MERRIDVSNLDLDRAASIIAARRSGWYAVGLTADMLTWMDNDAEWPAPLLTDRSQIQRPMSLGLRISGDAGEAEFVLYAGGWADTGYAPPGSDELTSEYFELDNAEEFGAVLDRVIGCLTGTQ